MLATERPTVAALERTREMLPERFCVPIMHEANRCPGLRIEQNE